MQTALTAYPVQSILADKPERNHKPEDVLTIAEFLKLLREEEDYFKGEEHNTKLMVTRLRKIFYDKWGWNKQLIRGAWNIKCRYRTKIKVKPPHDNFMEPEVKEVTRYKDQQRKPKYRWVTYRKDDRIFGSTRNNEIPFIYKNDHQEVLLPDGTYCDVAHVLAGIDAFNHPQVVSPLPSYLFFLHKLFPHVDSNADIVTWLGDIASSAGDFLFHYLKEGGNPLNTDTEQSYIDIDAPGSDMLGNIDAYVINTCYDVSAKKGNRVTDILNDYYCGDGYKSPDEKVLIFCKVIGLNDWNGDRFKDEELWLQYYQKQLRHNTAFQVYSLSEEGLRSVRIPIKIWCHKYDNVIKTRMLLEIFLKSLKVLLPKNVITGS